MRTPGRSTKDRLFAAAQLLDRGWGKAPMFVKLATDEAADERGAPQLTEMSQEEYSREVLRILMESGEIKMSDLDQQARDTQAEVVEAEPATPAAAAPPPVDLRQQREDLLRAAKIEPAPRVVDPVVVSDGKGHLAASDGDAQLRNVIKYASAVDHDPASYPQLRRELVDYAERFPNERAGVENALKILDARFARQ